MDDGAEGGREVLAQPRVAAPRRPVVGGRERVETTRVADLLERGQERDRQALGREQAVPQIVQRETAVARRERLMNGAAEDAPLLADGGVDLLLLPRADAIDELLQVRQPCRAGARRERPPQHRW